MSLPEPPDAQPASFKNSRSSEDDVEQYAQLQNVSTWTPGLSLHNLGRLTHLDTANSSRQEKEKVEQQPTVRDSEAKANAIAVVSILERLEHITWAWYLFAISTGGLALLLATQDNTFNGIVTIGKVIFIIYMALMLVLLALTAYRFWRVPIRLWKSLTFTTESLFFPAVPINAAIFISLVAIYGVPYCGEWLIVTVRVLFWIYYAMAIISSLFQFYILFTGMSLTVQSMTPAWLLPTYPVMICGTLASAIAADQPPTYRFPIIVGALTAQGFGFFFSTVMYAPWIARLMHSGFPAPPLRPVMFVAVGPPDFTSYALTTLANQLPADHDYFQAHPQAIPMLQTMAIAFSIFIWLMGFWFFALTCISIAAALPLRFNMAWYAFIFPNVGFVNSVNILGKELGSPGIEWVGSALTILTFAVYFVVLAFHVRALIRKDILYPGKDEDRDHLR